MSDAAAERTRGYSRREWAWAAYDWANSAFALTVMAAFFPLALRQIWLADGGPNATLILGLSNGAASLVIAVLGPVLGAFADAFGRRRRYLVGFAFLGIAATAGLAIAARGQWQLAAAAYFAAALGFAGTNVFYDAMLFRATDPDRRSRVSAFGYALGYIGGSLLFALHLFLLRNPGAFGLPDSETAMRVAFATVACWWAVFSVPLMIAFRDAPAAPPDGQSAMTKLRAVLPALIRHRSLRWFLIAYWFYIDGVHTIIRMAVDYGQAIGLAASDLALAILVTNLVGFPATLLYGWIASRVGVLRSLFAGVVAYLGITLLAVLADDTRDFFVLAACVGLVQGGVQAMSRAIFADLVPAREAATWFGVYNIVGRFAAVLGPVLVGLVSAATGEPRWSIGSVAILLLVGLVFLWQVKRSPSQAVE